MGVLFFEGAFHPLLLNRLLKFVASQVPPLLLLPRALPHAESHKSSDSNLNSVQAGVSCLIWKRLLK